MAILLSYPRNYVDSTIGLRKLQVVQAWRKIHKRAQYSPLEIGSSIFYLIQQCSLLFFIFFIVEFLYSLAKDFTGFNINILFIKLPYCGGSVRVMSEPINSDTIDIKFLEFGN
ncbi:MAG: hypothetical protein EZS28_007148 [Streblomastix strix]|uniref:Uncharacterized protein n=1 Tax=Streblomastix strix TaxID=222440 RepID=A0A5J4WT75_9EUKA|nr:MAG: hypothetical protein EZS28_007148 [Streblomastix strix]